MIPFILHQDWLSGVDRPRVLALEGLALGDQARQNAAAEGVLAAMGRSRDAPSHCFMSRALLRGVHAPFLVSGALSRDVHAHYFMSRAPSRDTPTHIIVSRDHSERRSSQSVRFRALNA